MLRLSGSRRVGFFVAGSVVFVLLISGLFWVPSLRTSPSFGTLTERDSLEKGNFDERRREGNSDEKSFRGESFSVRSNEYPGSGFALEGGGFESERLKGVSREEIRNLLFSFGDPTAKDLEWIANDPREISFSARLREVIGGNISSESMREIVDSARLAWFRMALLQRKYALGEIDFDSYRMGMEEMARLDKEVVSRNLTDSQYEALMNEPKTARGLFEVYSNEALPPQGLSELQSLFPRLRDEEMRNSSVETVYSVVPKNVLDEVVRVNREDLLRQQELREELLSGRISREDFYRESDVSRNLMREWTNALLSNQQKEFLFGGRREEGNPDQEEEDDG